MNESIQREMTLSRLLRTDKQIQFNSTHTVVHGIYDDNGLEIINISKDWDSIEGIDKLLMKLSVYELRCRYNAQRNAKYFISWVNNEILNKIQDLLRKSKFIEAKSLIINNSMTVL